MTIDLAAKYIGGAKNVSGEKLGELVRGRDGKTYMLDKTGHAWQVVAQDSATTEGQMRGGAPSLIEEKQIESFFERIVWATIEDPSTAQIKGKDKDTGRPCVRALTQDEWDTTLPPGLTIRHPYAYAHQAPPDRVGLRDYCARKEILISLSKPKNGSPTVRDLINLIHCMTLHYVGGHAVYLQTDDCQPKVWASHQHHMLEFDGIKKKENDGKVWNVRCSSYRPEGRESIRKQMLRIVGKLKEEGDE